MSYAGNARFEACNKFASERQTAELIFKRQERRPYGVPVPILLPDRPASICTRYMVYTAPYLSVTAVIVNKQIRIL